MYFTTKRQLTISGLCLVSDIGYSTRLNIWIKEQIIFKKNAIDGEMQRNTQKEKEEKLETRINRL